MNKFSSDSRFEAPFEARHDQPIPQRAGAAVYFQLEPWPDQLPEFSSILPQLVLDGHLDRHGLEMTIQYQMLGSIERLVIGGPSANPERRDELWRTTCLEFFLAAPGKEAYWEFNLSPEGHWNVYRFDGYRQGMAPEAGYDTLPFQVRRDPHSLQLSLHCPLPPGIGPDQPIEVGICAVLELEGSLPTFWALTHPGTKPDFHRRDSFAIRL